VTPDALQCANVTEFFLSRGEVRVNGKINSNLMLRGMYGEVERIGKEAAVYLLQDSPGNNDENCDSLKRTLSYPIRVRVT
jgi:hypothetical protein